MDVRQKPRRIKANIDFKLVDSVSVHTNLGKSQLASLKQSKEEFFLQIKLQKENLEKMSANVNKILEYKSRVSLKSAFLINNISYSFLHIRRNSAL